MTPSASQQIDKRIADLDDWRGEILARVRELIHEAVPDVTEEWKWKGTPVWSHNGIICTGETYKQSVKLTFAKGASLDDPSGYYNASLDGKVRRAIDFHEGDTVNAKTFKALVRKAVELNRADALARAKPAKKAGKSAKPTLLSGGNPQIPKGYGNEPVQAYIAALPGWKRPLAEQLDALIERTVPKVQKAVKWNSPLYGMDGERWFLSMHAFAKYMKVAFLNGASLRPMPPVESKHERTRYFHIHEDDELDEVQFAKWVKQASKLPGEKM